MSRAIFEAPMIRPCESLMGEMARDTSMSVPSLRLRTVWYGATCSPLFMRSRMAGSSSLWFDGMSSVMDLPITSSRL